MITDTQKQKIQQAIDTFSKDSDIIAIVKSIESGIKTTQNNYGKYMQFLTPYAKSNVTLYVISEALKLAGGNIQGINSAISILKGI